MGWFEILKVQQPTLADFGQQDPKYQKPTNVKPIIPKENPNPGNIAEREQQRIGEMEQRGSEDLYPQEQTDTTSQAKIEMRLPPQEAAARSAQINREESADDSDVSGEIKTVQEDVRQLLTRPFRGHMAKDIAEIMQMYVQAGIYPGKANQLTRDATRRAKELFKV